MNKELLKEYAEVKGQIKDLTAKAKELEPLVIIETRNVITELGSANLKTDIGTFSLTEKKNYTYSSEYEAKVVEVKEKTTPIDEEISKIKIEQITPLEEKITEVKQVLVDLAKEEEENGKAECKITDSLRFTAKKVKEETKE